MNTLTIPKNEYDLLNQQALAYKNLVSRLFEFIVKDSEENLINDFRLTNLYSEDFLNDLKSGIHKSSYFKDENKTFKKRSNRDY